MGFSEDNLKGFILALMSSLFIGASFIIKKKGLRRAAAASGVRAGKKRFLFSVFWNEILVLWNGSGLDCGIFVGIGGFSYLLEPLWWLGMITSKLSFFYVNDSSFGFGKIWYISCVRISICSILCKWMDVLLLLFISWLYLVILLI